MHIQLWLYVTTYYMINKSKSSIGDVCEIRLKGRGGGWKNMYGRPGRSWEGSAVAIDQSKTFKYASATNLALAFKNNFISLISLSTSSMNSMMKSTNFCFIMTSW